jgi:hypothetical protein
MYYANHLFNVHQSVPHKVSL